MSFDAMTGLAVVGTSEIAQAGSNRQYYRVALADGRSLIGTVGTSVQENRAFVAIARHFAGRGLNVPTVVAVSDDGLRYLQTDLGDTSLFDVLRVGREAGGQYGQPEVELLKRTIRMLPHWQMEGADGFDFGVCYPQPQFDRCNVMFDLNYFKYCFLKPSGVDFNEVELEDDFRRLADALMEDCGPWGFMIRDFQARNVMLVDGETPYLIDFQGGRRGPAVYDLVSFLWQASARYPRELKETLIAEYIDELGALGGDGSAVKRAIPLFVLFRTLQVLGAYGYRGYFERKKHFIDSIPFALRNLAEVVEQAAAYPHLYAALKALIAKDMTPAPTPAVPNVATAAENVAKLHVKVFSFGYKHGIPHDESGNGGGYVFDCRSIHNPGRYDEYKSLTGLDEPVIRFLEDDGEITRFLAHVYALADAHVSRYIERGFTSLMFCFGCTGGQHRSVYCAQHLAEHIHAKFGVRVTLCHREQGRECTI